MKIRTSGEQLYSQLLVLLVSIPTTVIMAYQIQPKYVREMMEEKLVRFLIICMCLEKRPFISGIAGIGALVAKR